MSRSRQRSTTRGRTPWSGECGLAKGIFPLAILRPKCRKDRAVIRGEAPIRRCQHVSLDRIPFPRHAGAQEDIIDAAVSVFLSEIVGPGDGHRVRAGTASDVVAVSFCGASIDQSDPAVAANGPNGSRILGIV